MPYKTSISGIYCITVFSGRQYVGSSRSIFQRWASHRGDLKRGTHRSSRLQAAWNKYGKLAFSILETCPVDSLNQKEQEWINLLKPVLNTTPFVNNVWANPESRAKMEATYKTKEFKEKRSAIARMPRKDWVPVDCSNGKSYPCMARAAEEFGVRVSMIRFLIATQRTGRLGVRFKVHSDPWRDVIQANTQKAKSRIENGHNKWSEEAKRKQSIRKKETSYRPSLSAIKAAVEKSRRPIVGKSIRDGSVVVFDSQRDAAMAITGRRNSSAMICKCCRGQKKTMYGYVWRYSE